MTGLQRLCKQFGEIRLNGELWVWDHVTNEARKRSEMTQQEWQDSEKVKWKGLLKQKEE